MKVFASLILISFIALAVFSFAGMSHGSEFSKCLKTALPQAMPCEVSHGIEMALAHAGIYHTFSTAITQGLALAFALLVIALSLQYTNLLQTLSIKKFAFAKQTNVWHSENKLNHWFAITEKRAPESV